MAEKLATVAVVDDGARGAVLAEAYARSPHVEKVFVFPGNGMTKSLSRQKQVIPIKGIQTTDKETIVKICKDENVHLLDVAQDNALASGVADLARLANIPTVGPSKDLARLESDKAFGRELAQKGKIPQPEYRVYKDPSIAQVFIYRRGDIPVFIKAAGLARGKGVIRAENVEEAINAIKTLKMDFPDAMEHFLVEEPIKEAVSEFSSFYAVSDNDFIHLGDAKDYKKAFDGNRGPNTGGMGAISFPDVVSDSILIQGREYIIKQTVKNLNGYRGIIYIGGMKTRIPPFYSLVEYNARMGDPEAQVIIPGINTDFFELNMAVATGRLSEINLETDKKARVVITLAANGYPEDYAKSQGKKIFGIKNAEKIEGVSIYGAGIDMNDNEEYIISGGRVLSVVGVANTLNEARVKAYEARSKIYSEDNSLYSRTDIGIEE